MIKFNKIPIGIKSCEKYIERRNTCKSTWIASLDKDKYLPLFLVGRKNQPSEIVEDILYLDCDDGYNNLVAKTTEFIKWYTENVAASHCILCDDDTYINCSIFNTFEDYKQYDYSGSFIYGQNKIPNQRSGYCSGCFYTLSNKAANHYLTQYDPSMVSGVFYEDLCTGNLINTDLTLTKLHLSNIEPWGGHRNGHRYDQYMINHYVVGEAMYKMHESICQ